MHSPRIGDTWTDEYTTDQHGIEYRYSSEPHWGRVTITELSNNKVYFRFAPDEKLGRGVDSRSYSLFMPLESFTRWFSKLE